MQQNYNGSYRGKPVQFAYDDTEYSINENGQLHYIGTETDGTKIRVPDGVVDGTGMYSQTNLTSGVQMNDTLEVMDDFYLGCNQMVEPGEIRNGVTSIKGAYANTGIKTTPFMPDSVEHADFAFNECPSLESCNNFSENLVSANCMFSQDKNLKTLPENMPESLLTMDGFASGCEKLEKAPRTNEMVEVMDNAYAGAYSLTDKPYIPEGASAENVLADCRQFEQTDNKELSHAFQAAQAEAQSSVEEAKAPLNRTAALATLTDSIDQTQDDLEAGI